MSPQDWAAFILTISTLITVAVGGVRFLVKHYFDAMKTELKPNGGGSMKDQITRLESRMNEADHMRRQMDKKIDKIYEALLTYAIKDKD